MYDQSDQVIAVIIVFFLATYLAFGFRVYKQVFVHRSFRSEDALAASLLVLFTVYLGAQIQSWKHGLGKYDVELAPADRSAALMWWWVCLPLYILCASLAKVSAGLFLVRMAVNPVHVKILRVFIVGTCLCGAIYFFVVMFQCNPPTVWWKESPRAPGKCWSDPVVLGVDLSGSIFNCFGDWAFGILPLFVAWSRNTQGRANVALGCLLSFAAIGSLVALIRIFFLPRLLSGDDFLFNSAEVASLSTVECGIIITAVLVGTLALPEEKQPIIVYGLEPEPWVPPSRPSRAYVRTTGGDPSQLSPTESRGFLGPFSRSTMSSTDAASMAELGRLSAVSILALGTITKTVEVTQSSIDIVDLKDSMGNIIPPPSPIVPEELRISNPYPRSHHRISQRISRRISRAPQLPSLRNLAARKSLALSTKSTATTATNRSRSNFPPLPNFATLLSFSQAQRLPGEDKC